MLWRTPWRTSSGIPVVLVVVHVARPLLCTAGALAVESLARQLLLRRREPSATEVINYSKLLLLLLLPVHEGDRLLLRH